MRRQQESWAFEPPDLQRLDSLLTGFLRDTQVRYALVLDREGQVFGTAGDPGGLDVVSFASLAAADFAASGELAHLLGEDDFASLYHQSDHQGMFLVDVSGRAILAALFGQRTTLGLLRLRVRDLVPELMELLDAVRRRGGGESPVLESEWLSEAETQIDRLFGA
ncbi:MAG: roadblock/LC7 domain-containing protein [Longimicrobiales bacterium]